MTMKPDVSIAGDKAITGLHGRSYSGEAALAIEGISHCYGPRQALGDVSFTVAPASSLALSRAETFSHSSHSLRSSVRKSATSALNVVSAEMLLV